MDGLASAYRCEANKETKGVYFHYLKDFSLEAVRYAVDSIIKGCEKFPTVSLLRTHANAYRPPVNRTVVPAFQIEEFSGEELEKFKDMTADDFFKSVEQSFIAVS